MKGFGALLQMQVLYQRVSVLRRYYCSTIPTRQTDKAPPKRARVD